MNQDQLQFMTLRRLPARLTAQQVAWLLGFQEQQIPILVSTGLLDPLGSPAASAQKFFARSIIERLERDAHWLDRASKKVTDYWKKKNARRTKNKLKILAPDRVEETAVEIERPLRRA